MKRLFLIFFLCVFANAAATTYYVRPDGNDANTGTGTGTGDALKTVDHAIDSHAVDGDTVIIAPGVYREAVSLSNGGSAGSIITVRGDPRNESGFAGITAGPVRITGYTTDDKTDHGNTALTLGTTDYLTFEDIWFDGGDNTAVSCSNGSDHITFNRCCVVNYGGATIRSVYLQISTDASADWTFNNCVFVSSYVCIQITPQATPTSAELDLNVSVNNCIFYCLSSAVACTDRGGTYPFAGIDIKNCTAISGTFFAYSTTASNDGTIKNSITGCVAICGTGISTSATRTVVTEDWNLLLAGTVRSAGESAGANTQTKYAALINFGQYDLWFRRPFSPLSINQTSTLAGFDGSGANMTTDFFGRMRPSGPWLWATTNSAVGAIEAHDFGTKDTATYDSGSSIALVGPGDQQIVVPVKAQATVLSVKAAFGNLYSGTAPQAVLLAAPELGVTTETLTMAETDTNTFETLTFGSQTPTAQGAVIIRLISNCTSTNGQSWFDTVTRNY